MTIILVMMETSPVDKLLKRLNETGPAGLAARQYLDVHKVQVRLKSQSTGARWTLRGGIELNPTQLVNEPYALSLIVHEVCHMRQGFYKALSVQGELFAWQEQFACLHAMSGRYSTDDSKNGLIEELMGLSPESRNDLMRARELMGKFAGKKYHINWLPVFPLLREIGFWFTGR